MIKSPYLEKRLNGLQHDPELHRQNQQRSVYNHQTQQRYRPPKFMWTHANSCTSGWLTTKLWRSCCTPRARTRSWWNASPPFWISWTCHELPASEWSTNCGRARQGKHEEMVRVVYDVIKLSGAECPAWTLGATLWEDIFCSTRTSLTRNTSCFWRNSPTRHLIVDQKFTVNTPDMLENEPRVWTLLMRVAVQEHQKYRLENGGNCSWPQERPPRKRLTLWSTYFLGAIDGQDESKQGVSRSCPRTL